MVINLCTLLDDRTTCIIIIITHKNMSLDTKDQRQGLCLP